MIEAHLRPSGKYQLYVKYEDPVYIKKAWQITARGINHVIDIYALGKGARYPDIDSTSFAVSSNFYQTLLRSLTLSVGNELYKKPHLFFLPTLKFALGLLKVNHRNEAVRFEPLTYGQNLKAYQYIPDISWKKYPYSVILVPGRGTIHYTNKINPAGKLRCRLAAQRYREGKAPLIIVSGGFVHPFRTKHNEAYQMKKYLMKTLSIPEKAIIMEPYARHTTTNFRNAVRLMYRYNIPTDKRALVTTTVSQSYYITNGGLAKRCKRELGYVPYKSLKRISVNDVTFLPVVTSMQCNPFQPLDP